MPSAPDSLDYHSSARRDLRIWAMFLVGIGFFWAGSTVDPLTNCSEDGRECAPWLVPIAQWMGAAFAAAGAGLLWANPGRGCRVDPATGDLLWWQGSDHGRIHPSQIGRILIRRRDDSADDIHLYGLDGGRQPFFDAEVIPWPQDRWVQRLVDKWPCITVEIR